MITVPLVRQLLSLGRKVQRYAPETLAQQTRIVADGGTVIDLAFMDTVIKTLKAQSILTASKFLGDANIAVKKDGSGAVSKLYDISGNDNDAVQATGSAQPIWTAAQQNGKAGLVFDGSDDRLATSASVVGGTSMTAIAVGSLVSVTGNYRTQFIGQWNSGGSPGTNNWNMAIGDYSGAQTRDPLFGVEIESTATNSGNPTEIDLNTCMILEGIHDGSNTTLLINGSQKDQDAAVGTMNNAAGRVMHIGSIINGDYASNIKFEAGLIFAAALTAPQRAAVEALLNTYYAIY